MTKKITIKNVIGLEIELDGNQKNADIDLGSITLNLLDKEFIFDIIQSYRNYENNNTTVSCDVEIDKETFEDCKFDLTDLELLSNEVKGMIYLRIDDMSLFKSATLYVKVRQTTRAINLTIDY